MTFQQMLEGTERNKNKSEMPIQIQSRHILLDQCQSSQYLNRERSGLVRSQREHSLGMIHACHLQPSLYESQGYTARAARQFERAPTGLTCDLRIEGDIPGDL